MMFHCKINPVTIIAITYICAYLLINNCSQTETGGTADKSAQSSTQITVTADSVVICWNPPAENADSVDYYELGYRTSTPSTWTVIKGNIPVVGSPSTTVFRSDVDPTDSTFHFAVRSVAKNGIKSAFHSSFDPTAGGVGDDMGAWHLYWPKR